ncbi:PIR protein [Plasmodium yoelii]|uniref:PIR protein n=2 Tax=Plasmodium yoelii TaxID=5861 RepID=A0AAE9WR30_PLAYO|nr:PIR protein [Plasmodium yoelii]WBY58346.1 PIR protein [Plasmodium yoelii yoelii]CDS44136.1 YIR protein [Plasmodium yoelii]VTZ79262.1 PIR protein [Plasmodium yoelii]|eukprot:XP_022810785.1 PIR protein [Plasmodium yoelii]
MSSNVCNIINLIDKSFDDDPNNPEKYQYMDFFNSYCPEKNCDTDDKKIISTFITLLKIFDEIDDEHLENDKLADYAILWLSYIINQKTQNGTTTLNEFYTDRVAKYNKYEENISTNKKINKDVIDKKIKSMNIDIKDISNFYDAFKSLCNMYIEIVPDDYQCNKCLESAGELFEKYEKLKNALDINKGSFYFQLLSNLSNYYKNFENEYNRVKCKNSPPFVACPRSSVTKNTLITIAIIFVAASILLGVSYKYSLFGFRKRSQKQHLREMLKK